MEDDEGKALRQALNFGENYEVRLLALLVFQYSLPSAPLLPRIGEI